MSKTKLKLCPFCGGKASLKNLGLGTGAYIVWCNCGVLMTAYAQKSYSIRGIHKEIKQKVIKAWNKRA